MTASYEDAPIRLNNGIEAQTLRIPTGNPTSYYALINDPEAVEACEIVAKLFLPKGPGPFPVVIVVPGSLGVAQSHVAKADYLTDAGIAACVVDPFGMRGVTSTVANQAQYTFAASAWDVLCSAVLLAARDDIDERRIGAQGHSRGGAAVLTAATLEQRIAEPPAFGLRAVYGAYPWSGHQFLRPVLGDTKVRAVIGDRDEWCLPQQVQGHVHAMRLCGGDASFRLFAGAHHSFDRNQAVGTVADAALSPGAPTVYITDEGAMIHPLTGEPDASLSERDLMVYALKAGYGKKGARIGSEGDQAAAFHEDMMRFWRAAMAD